MITILSIALVVLGGIIGYLLYVLFDYRQITKQISFINHERTNQQLKCNSRNKNVVALDQQINQLLDAQQKVTRKYVKSQNQLNLAIHNISHDLRTPLTVASGYTQVLLKTNNLDSDAKKQLASINRNLNALTKNLDLLLLYNRLIEKRITPNLQQVDVSKITQQAILNIYDALKEKGIFVNLDIQPRLVWLMDEAIFQRIIQNVFGNILDHGSKQATIFLRKEGTELILRVKNQLLQPIKNPQNLIDRFYTEDLARKTKNSGLGLYIVAELTKLLNGKVDIATHDLEFEIKLVFKIV